MRRLVQALGAWPHWEAAWRAAVLLLLASIAWDLHFARDDMPSTWPVSTRLDDVIQRLIAIESAIEKLDWLPRR